MTAARSIVILAFADVQLLDVAGPLQVFATANELAAGQGLDTPYAPRVVAPISPLVTSAGLALCADPLPPADAGCDTLIAAGGHGVRQAAADRVLTDWIAAMATGARRTASVCSGAFLLAAAGLLDGRRVATHWAHCEELHAAHPALRVEPDPIFIHDGPVWTSAGVTAGIDLALALVEDDLGRALAHDVARQLVVFLKRPGGQAQFSTALSLQRQDDPFADLHAWVSEHLAADLSVATLAAHVGMSERSFLRHYRARTGITPARAVERLRIEAALRLLADSTQPVKRIAARCGFGSEETLRRNLQRAMGVSPQAWRERFTSTGSGLL
jgi:transcriptional regulator GlxA family with amidase domain